MLLHIVKHSRKNFFCRECKGEHFIFLGADTHLNPKKSPTLYLIMKCEDCGSINTMPVFAVRSMEIDEERKNNGT